MNKKINYLHFTAILTSMNKNIMDQNEYESYKEEVTKWLDNANKIIDKHSNIKNIDDLHSNLNEIMVSFYLILFLERFTQFFITYLYLITN